MFRQSNSAFYYGHGPRPAGKGMEGGLNGDSPPIYQLTPFSFMIL